MTKTILITGASSGFGLMLANKLHQQGFNVIGTSREPEKYADKAPFKLLRLNIDDDKSIQSFIDELFRLTKRLDVLVNNAGYMVTGLAEETPLELGRQQFETNFWGTVKVTNALLPHFRKQKQGQIITVSSIVGLIGPPNLSYYTASKHAVCSRHHAVMARRLRRRRFFIVLTCTANFPVRLVAHRCVKPRKSKVAVLVFARFA